MTRKPAPPRRPRAPTPAKAARWEVVLPFHMTSLNVLMRMHWARRDRLMTDEAIAVAGFCNVAGVPRASGKRRVTQRITLAGRDRRRDDDNAWKGLLDALRDCGRLVDDGPDFVEKNPLEFDRAKVRKTTLIIEDIG